MKTREEATKYGLSFPDTYLETPFHDPNWELVRVRGSKKAFLWVYERNGYINMNVKGRPVPFLPLFPHIIRIKNTGIRSF